MPYVYINPHKASYMAAVQELQQRRKELVFVQQRILQLEETIRVLEPLASEAGVAPTAGLTELCRQVLMAQPNSQFTAELVMQHLAVMGIDMSGYSNPLAVIHTTLTRLVRPGSGIYKGGQPGTQPFYVYQETIADKFRKAVSDL
jgi:hypothetical protein